MINSYGTQDLRYINSRIFQKIKNNRIVTNGNYCKLFERKISKLVKARYAVACKIRNFYNQHHMDLPFHQTKYTSFPKYNYKVQ